MTHHENALERRLADALIQLMSAGEVNTALAAMEKPADTPLLGIRRLNCKRTGYQAMLRPRIEFSPDKSVPGSPWTW